MKLTRPQIVLLRKLPSWTRDNYGPAIVLVEKGLAYWKVQGSYGYSRLEITDAGRKWLEQNPEAKA